MYVCRSEYLIKKLKEFKSSLRTYYEAELARLKKSEGFDEKNIRH